VFQLRLQLHGQPDRPIAPTTTQGSLHPVLLKSRFNEELEETKMHSDRRLFLKTLTAVLYAGALIAAPASAQQSIRLTIGASHPTVLPWINLMQTYFQPEVNKRLADRGNKFKIVWTEGYGGVLYKANATLTSVGERVVDIGWVFSAVEGAKLPLSQVSNYAPAVSGDPRIMIDAFNELVPATPALRGEWDRNNVVFLSAFAADTLDLYTTFPVRSIADLQGKRLGAAGTIATLVGGVGAVAVDSPLPSMYNDIKSGVTSGQVTIATGAMRIKLYEAAPYVTRVDLGSFFAGALAANKNTWTNLPQEVRDVIQGVARDWSRRVGEAMYNGHEGALKAMVARGKTQNPPVSVADLPAAERARWIASLPNLAQEWVKANEAKGLPARQLLSAYMETMRRRGAKPVRAWDK
jgi:TRAP-type C4-dicarboxylate transport system substrate-binding protein